MSNEQLAMSNGRKMKPSGVEWIGEIPERWKVAKVGLFYSFSSGDTLTSEEISETGEYLVYGANGVRGYYSKGNLKGKHILIGRVGALCGNVHIVDSTVWVTEHALIAKKKIDSFENYYGYVFESMNLIQYSKASAQPVISSDSISMLRFPIPPLDEQARIADFLDRRCAEIDSVIAETKMTIEEYKALRQSIITEAVTKGIRGPRPMKPSGIEWIGEIPEEWDCMPIKYVAEFMPPCNLTALDKDSEITYLPMECLKNGYSVPKTSEYGKLATSLTQFENGDIVMAKVTPCFENGNIAIMDDMPSGFGMGSSELFVYRPTDVIGKHLLYWLQNDLFKGEACATMTGTGGLKRVSPYFAKHSHVIVPSETEQQEIAEYLDEKCAEIELIIAAKQSLLEDMEAYKKSVIYEYVTGKKQLAISNEQ